MTRDQKLDQLRRHQDAATDILTRGVACLEDGPDRLLASAPGLRAELSDTLGAYQSFKHAEVFDPALASDDPERRAAHQGSRPSVKSGSSSARSASVRGSARTSAIRRPAVPSP